MEKAKMKAARAIMGIREEDGTISPSLALRRLVDNTGMKWSMMTSKGCDGMGHINDLWHFFYKDMEAIVCLEKFIADHDPEESKGCDFRPVIGFPQYGEPKEKDEEDEK